MTNSAADRSPILIDEKNLKPIGASPVGKKKHISKQRQSAAAAAARPVLPQDSLTVRMSVADASIRTLRSPIDRLSAPQLNKSLQRTDSRSECESKLQMALKRFTKDPTSKNSLVLYSLVLDFEAKYKVTGNSKYVPVYQGGLPGLGKRS